MGDHKRVKYFTFYQYTFACSVCHLLGQRGQESKQRVPWHKLQIGILC